MNTIIEGILLSLMGVALMVIVVLVVTRWRGKNVFHVFYEKDMLHIVLIWVVVMAIFVKMAI